MIRVHNTPIMCYSVPYGTYMMYSVRVHEVVVMQEKSKGAKQGMRYTHCYDMR